MRETAIAARLSRNARCPTAAGERPWVSIVDPDLQSRSELKSALAILDVEVRTYDAAEKFLECLDGGLPACLITEARLPAMSGLGLLRHLKACSLPVPTIILARNAEVPTAVEAIREGAVDFLEKPFLDGRVVECVLALLSL